MDVAKILMLSGGIDSTYLSWKMVKDRTPKLHIHHISIRNSIEKLWVQQDARVPKIIDYLKTIWAGFRYSESIFDFTGFGRIGWDSDVVLLVGQKIALNYPTRESELIIGWTPYDAGRPIVADRIDRRVTPNIWEALIESAANKEYINKSLKFPLMEQGITKAQMIKEMPKELLDMTWTCRQPNKGRECGKCHACTELKEARNQ